MNNERKVGIMVDNTAIELNITRMTDSLRNANYQAVVASGIKENDEGDYLDEDGDNLIMEEGVVKALLHDALDSYIVATLPGKNKTDPNEFTYYLWDSFPNIAEYVANNATIGSYVSALFASTCGILAASLSPAISDITESGLYLADIETFHQDQKVSYYLLTGEPQDQEDTDPMHETSKMSTAERRERVKIDLIKELGVEGYQAHLKKQQDLNNVTTQEVDINPTWVAPTVSDIDVTPKPNPHNTLPDNIRLTNEPANLFPE